MKNSDQNTNNVFSDKAYIEKVYSDVRRPKTDYPFKLANHLKENYFEGTGSLVDVGCGRGDMVHAFAETGFSVTGVDLSPASEDFCKPHPVKICDLANDVLPFDDNSFNYIFSKSVIEHIRDPMLMIKETYRVMEAGGTSLLMTPSWMHTSWGPFYLDHTHVTPWTIPSLRDAMEMAGYKDIKVYHFYQLPFLWKYPWMKPIPKLIQNLPIRYKPMYDVQIPVKLNTFLRFSNEVMLLAVGKK